ncbi:MAG: choice-of-anchor L domain-containing protein [Polyangiaceae bacterium]|nr:choice-of-anchor L domain-containing protein [Polyangiaceae bacterium]
MKNELFTALAGVLALVGASACSSTSSGGDDLFAGGASGGTAAGGGGGMNVGGAASGGGGSGGGLLIDSGTGTGGGGGPSCDSGPTEDKDKDGQTKQDGDCNDCDPNANAGAYDVAGNKVDEDCNGTPDDTLTDCDGAITDVADADPMNGARAIGLCQQATASDKKWGVLEAKWVAADGSPLPTSHADGHGLLAAYGPNVNCQEGKRLLALSSGTARQPTDPGYKSPSGATSPATSPCPTGFPIESPSCNNAVSGKTANDPAGLELKIRVPTNAKSFSFNFNFYTFEWPSFVCTTFNDFFVALLNPATSAQPPQYGNISFDTQKNPVSVNNAFLEACDPKIGAGNPGGKNFPCSLGIATLQGTGFEPGHAATGWLETVSPITPGGEMILRYAVWDAGDHILDSTVLVDNFKFSADEASNTPTTKPVPTPK